MLKEKGWALKTIIFSGGEATHSHGGTWLAIRNELSSTGYVLRISKLGLMTYEYTDEYLGVGVNQHGSVRPMRGSADFQFITQESIVSEISVFDRKYTLYLAKDLSCLRLNEGGLFVLALDGQGLWRYNGYGGSGGYAASDDKGRIQILRTGFNAAK